MVKSDVKKNVHVKEYSRTKNGKTEHVGAYTRKQVVNPDLLKELDEAEAMESIIEQYKKTHPDARSIAKETFLYPNEYWRKNQSTTDTLFIDAPDAPTVSEYPPDHSGTPGTIVLFKGSYYLANKYGNYHLYAV